MKKHRILLLCIGITAALLLASLTYISLSDRSPYDHSTGIGSGLAVSPDDKSLAFSYYQDGMESIYIGDIGSGTAEKVTGTEEQDHRLPKFSPDGESLLYLSANNDNVQSLHYLSDGETAVLTDAAVHVFSAAFSADGSTIYYSAMPAEDFLAPEGKMNNGTDLFAVRLDGSQIQLTDKDAFSMDDLTVSPEGNLLFYSSFEGTQQLHAFDLEQQSDSVFMPQQFQGDTYTHVFSPEGDSVAYTAVADESMNGTFEYELFLQDTDAAETTRLTDLNAAVTSPVFFHGQERIAFLFQRNWPGEPASYEIMTSDFEGNTDQLAFTLPESAGFQPAAIMDRLINSFTLAMLYLLLFGLLSVYFHLTSNKVYLPVLLSAGLAALVFLGSFAAAASNPWAGIGFFMISTVLAVCTGALFLFAFILRRIAAK